MAVGLGMEAWWAGLGEQAGVGAVVPDRRLAGVSRDHDALLAYGCQAQPRLASGGRRQGEGGRELAAAHGGDEVGRVPLYELDPCRTVGRQGAAKQRYEVGAQPAAQCLRGAPLGVEALARLAQCSTHLASGPQQRLPGGGKPRARGRALRQRSARQLLQRRQAAADRGLPHAQQLGGGALVAGLRHGQEREEVLGVRDSRHAPIMHVAHTCRLNRGIETPRPDCGKGAAQPRRLLAAEIMLE